MSRATITAALAVALSACGANGNGSSNSHAEKPATADRFAQPIFQDSHFPFKEVIELGSGGKDSGGQYGVCLRTQLVEVGRDKPYQCELAFLFGIELADGKQITKRHARYLSARAMNRAIDELLPSRAKADRMSCHSLKSFLQAALRKGWPGANLLLCDDWKGKALPLSGIESTLRLGRPKSHRTRR